MILQISHASEAQRGEHHIQVAEVPGSMDFSHSKTWDANIAAIGNFSYFV